jgi:hypothetical protein
MGLTHLDLNTFRRVCSLAMLGSLLHQLSSMDEDEGLASMFVGRDTIDQLSEDDLEDV